ncbi:MAG: molybdopterin molybdotransferase MoeA [Flavobacteriales bacterium]|nr:molybdopterin molybdotransferase MoeA [Flavobacteriales bacterium]
MITCEQARTLLLDQTSSPGSTCIALSDAVGRILSSDLISPTAHPHFDQSAMDGYCFSHSSLSHGSVLKLCGEIQAGGDSNIEIGPGECARIFTGAQIPASCDTVIMQEQTSTDKNHVTLNNAALKIGANVRVAGEQIKKGETALTKGTILNSAAIGFLASLGVEKVEVTQQLKVHIICTGNEFAENEADLEKGKIYESNGQMLVTCLAKLGIKAAYETCADQLLVLKALIALREQEADLLLITGGVSVGDYDFTVPALEANGFETIFHKVSQKPGKPLLFSTKHHCAAFGLPGNPRAVLICFHEYVREYILRSMGSDKPFLSKLRLPLEAPFKKKDDHRTHFLAATIEHGKASLLRVQGSHMLGSMAAAEGLIVLPPEGKEYRTGDLVEYHLLNQ